MNKKVSKNGETAACSNLQKYYEYRTTECAKVHRRFVATSAYLLYNTFCTIVITEKM